MRDESVDVRSAAIEDRLEEIGRDLDDEHGHRHPQEDLQAPMEERKREREQKPDRAVAPGVGDAAKDRIEKTDSVADNPRLEMTIPAQHGGEGYARSTLPVAELAARSVG